MNEKEMDINTDVVELCSLLRCLGFSVRSLDTSDVSLSQDIGGSSRTVVINCQSSGIHVVMESGNAACSCPVTSQESSGVWQVSAVSGGKHHDKEVGSTLLGNLPKTFTEQVGSQLRGLVRKIREQNEIENELAMGKKSYRQEESQGRDTLPNRSASMIEFKVTPEKRNVAEIETPSRYRSLGCLNNAKEEFELPAPRPLTKISTLSHNYKSAGEDLGGKLKLMCKRQSTYTVSTPGSSRNRNKTSSPIHPPASSVLQRLIGAEKAAEELRNKLADLIQDFTNDDRTSSISSLALDVSKISLLKASEASKTQFVSSPNLSAPAMAKDDLTKSKLRRFESASTSNLSGRKLTPKNQSSSKLSKLRKLSPSCFFSKKESKSGHEQVTSQNENKGAKADTPALIKAKIAKPIRTGIKQRSHNEASKVNVSANKNKYSHIKSTIPRPTPTKKL